MALVFLVPAHSALARQGQPGPEPTTQATPASDPYDIWTAKRLTGDWAGLRPDLEDAGVNFSILLGTMTQFNFRGGVNTHNAHETAGKAFYNVELDFEKMGLLDGATFFARAIQTWNSGIRADVGSLTPPYWSAGSGGDQSLVLDKYWYRQRLLDDRVEIRLGKLLNVTDLFDKNAHADSYLGEFMNRALAHNMTIPATKGIGAFAKVWPVDWLYAQAMVVDPDADTDHHRHGTSGWETAFHDEDRFRALWEVGVAPKYAGWMGGLPGTYRVGAWFDPGPKTLFAGGTQSDDYGWYLNFDQMVWKESNDAKCKQGLGVFARYGWAHRDVNRLAHFWSLGASYTGLIPERDVDVLGVGVAQSIFSQDYRAQIDEGADRETVYELYYAIKVTPWCIISPDVQVVTNPGGDKDVRDALVGGVRVKLSF